MSVAEAKHKLCTQKSGLTGSQSVTIASELLASTTIEPLFASVGGRKASAVAVTPGPIAVTLNAAPAFIGVGPGGDAALPRARLHSAVPVPASTHIAPPGCGALAALGSVTSEPFGFEVAAP